MAEGTAPLFTNFRTGEPIQVPTAGLADGSVTTPKLADSAVTTPKLADSAVTAIKLATDAVTTVKILNGAVTNTKLADMVQQLIKARKTLSTGALEDVTITELLDFITSGSTRGNIIYRGASAWSALAPGTATHVLTSNGVGADPTYQATAGGITTIASGSLPAAATLDITSIPATYAYLVLQLIGVSSNTATRQVLVQVDSDNGASFDTTAGNYFGFTVDNAAVVAANTLASLIESVVVGATTTVDVTLVIKGYQGGPRLQCTFSVRDSGGSARHSGIATYVGTASAINALRILWNGTGNFDAGTYALFGAS